MFINTLYKQRSLFKSPRYKLFLDIFVLAKINVKFHLANSVNLDEDTEYFCYFHKLLNVPYQSSMKYSYLKNNLTNCLYQMCIHFDNVICISDLNYNLLKKETCKPIRNICLVNVVNVIKNPTWFTKTFAHTLTDVFLTNSRNFLSNTKILTVV